MRTATFFCDLKISGIESNWLKLKSEVGMAVLKSRSSRDNQHVPLVKKH